MLVPFLRIIQEYTFNVMDVEGQKVYREVLKKK